MTVAWCLRVLFLSVFLMPLTSWASLFQQYGVGARNVGLGNSTGAMATDAFSLLYNPALMNLQGKMLLSGGVVGAFEQFDKIENILIDIPETGADTSAPDGGYVHGNADTNVPNTFLLTAGFQTPLSHSEHPAHLGVALVTPVDKLVTTETEDPFVPQYTMYMSDLQRFGLATAVAFQPSEKFGFGIGANFYMSQGATTKFRLPSSGGRQSSGLFKADIKPGAAFTAGAIYIQDENITHGLAWNQEVRATSKIDAQNELSLITPATIFIHTSNVLFYDPEIFQYAICLHDKNDKSLNLAARWERWSKFSGTAMIMKFDTFTSSFQQTLPPSDFHDVISLHTGFEKKMFGNENWIGRLGYEFKPTPVPNQDGAINYVDNDKHVAQVGAGWNTKHFLGVDFEMLHIDTAAFFQYIMPKDVVKAKSTYIGAPGYHIGGWVFGATVTLTTEI